MSILQVTLAAEDVMPEAAVFVIITGDSDKPEEGAGFTTDGDGGVRKV